MQSPLDDKSRINKLLLNNSSSIAIELRGLSHIEGRMNCRPQRCANYCSSNIAMHFGRLAHKLEVFKPHPIEVVSCAALSRAANIKVEPHGSSCFRILFGREMLTAKSNRSPSWTKKSSSLSSNQAKFHHESFARSTLEAKQTRDAVAVDCSLSWQLTMTKALGCNGSMSQKTRVSSCCR